MIIDRLVETLVTVRHKRKERDRSSVFNGVRRHGFLRRLTVGVATAAGVLVFAGIPAQAATPGAASPAVPAHPLDDCQSGGTNGGGFYNEVIVCGSGNHVRDVGGTTDAGIGIPEENGYIHVWDSDGQIFYNSPQATLDPPWEHDNGSWNLPSGDEVCATWVEDGQGPQGAPACEGIPLP